LEREGYLVFNKEKLLPTRLKILVNNMEYYNFEIKYPKYEELLKTILRSYGEAFEKYLKINEYDIARKIKRNVDVVINDLNTLHKIKIIEYLPQSKSTQLIFLVPRVDAKTLTFANNSYKWRMEKSEQRLNALISYAYNKTVCRSVQLLQYFAEKADNCGFCDVCIEMKKLELTTSEFEKIKSEIISYLEIEPHSIDFLKQHIIGINQNKLTHSIQLLLDSEIIHYNSDMKLCWSKEELS
jgi:ATP-dependent DNA helicase RecQ